MRVSTKDRHKMRQPLDRPLEYVFVTCLDYYLTNTRKHSPRPSKLSESYKQVKRALTTTLQAMAALHAIQYSGWSADRDHPGYLIKCEPPMLFRVPYHVVPSFPIDQELEALWHLSRVIRSGDRSVISISGSNVMRKIFDIVGDVDFCEYFPVSDRDGFAKIAANMDGNQRIACMKLAMLDRNWKSNKEWRYPWGIDRPNENFFASTFSSSDEDKSMMKADYVGDIDCLGVTEITNVIIAVDDSGNSASLSKTFAAQEAPLVPVDWLPNQMNEPIEMGRYINWLTETILALRVKGDMRKCLKRCASLSRVLFLPAISNEIASLADENTILLSQKLSELRRLLEILASLNDIRSPTFSASLLQRITETAKTLEELGGPPDAIALKRFDEEVSGIVEKLLSHVRPWYDPSSRSAA